MPNGYDFAQYQYDRQEPQEYDYQGDSKETEYTQDMEDY